MHGQARGHLGLGSCGLGSYGLARGDHLLREIGAAQQAVELVVVELPRAVLVELVKDRLHVGLGGRVPGAGPTVGGEADGVDGGLEEESMAEPSVSMSIGTSRSHETITYEGDEERDGDDAEFDKLNLPKVTDAQLADTYHATRSSHVQQTGKGSVVSSSSSLGLGARSTPIVARYEVSK